MRIMMLLAEEMIWWLLVEKCNLNTKFFLKPYVISLLISYHKWFCFSLAPSCFSTLFEIDMQIHWKGSQTGKGLSRVKILYHGHLWTGWWGMFYPRVSWDGLPCGLVELCAGEACHAASQSRRTEPPAPCRRPVAHRSGEGWPEGREN